jgi:hypothetical protein
MVADNKRRDESILLFYVCVFCFGTTDLKTEDTNPRNAKRDASHFIFWIFYFCASFAGGGQFVVVR